MKKIITIILIVALLTSGCAKSRHNRDFFAMDTVISLTVYGDDVTDIAKKEVERLDKLLSATDPDSDITKYNEGKSITDETKALLERCDEITQITDGAFDITVQAAVELWDVTKASKPPKDDDVKAVLADKSRIGLGAIAKGYGAAQVRKKLVGAGIKSAIVSFGSSIALIGSNPDGRDWNVGILHPVKSDSLIGKITASDTAVVTSGGYQRYFEYQGKRYHHILDPSTGYPADSGILSATVVTDDDTLADALSTAVYVMGVDKATELYRSQDIELILVTNDTVYVTEGLDFTLDDDDFKIEVIKK